MKGKNKLIGIALLGMIAGGALGCGGTMVCWLYGDLAGQNDGTSAESAKLMQICENLTKGDTQGLLDATAFQMEEYYSAHYLERFEDEPGEVYRSMVKSGMDAAYAYYFEGKEIEVRQIDMAEVIIPTFAGSDTTYNNLYMYEFYENDELLLTMTFEKITDGKYEISEEYAWEESGPSALHPIFTSAIYPQKEYNVENWEIFMKNQYEEALNGEEQDGLLCGAVQRFGMDFSAYAEEIKEKTRPLYADGWIFKDMMLRPDGFDSQAGLWTYKVRFEIENTETGAVCFMEQKFHYFDEYLYVNENYAPVIINGNGDIPAEVEDLILNLF